MMISRKVVQYCALLLAVVVIHISLLGCTVKSAPVGINRKSFRATKNYLRQFGYLPKKLKRNFSEELFMKALKDLQNFSGLNATGKVDFETLGKMRESRCGVRDLEDQSEIIDIEEDSFSGERVKRSSSRRRLKIWSSRHLTYRIWRGASDLPLDVTRDVMRQAFLLWSQVTDLKFKETSSWFSDINIFFTTKNHYDGSPFDGKGRVLAHAFPPGYGIGGDIHFDDQERWGERKKGPGSEYVLNLLQVASHEIGHSLGLPHSKDKKDLMAPFYETSNSVPKLSTTDIENIQNLYGVPLLETKNSLNKSKKFLTNQL